MADRKLALKNLERFVSTRTSEAEVTFERLMAVARADDAEDLAELLADLVHRGDIEQFVRVESQLGGGGIDDFPNVLAVPQRINDWRTGADLVVTPDNLRIMYRIRPKKETRAERG